MTDWERARAAARATRDALDARDETPADTLIDSAAQAAGLRIRSRPPRDPLLAGAHAVLDNEARSIWIRSDAAAADRRLILAHEIGHCQLHHAPDECRCDPDDLLEDAPLAAGYGPRQRRETEANAFAREFLLPAESARRAFFDRGLDAHAIAADAGLPVGIVFAQLALPPASNDAASRTEAAAPPLDPSQEEAARAAAGPLLVGAGPGTGKTRTLTARVLYLVQECGVPPERLLALTFSRKAAAEMRERIAAQAPQIAARAAITTFHAFGLDLLRRHWAAAGLPPRPVLVTEAEALALLERRIAQVELDALRYLHDPAFPLPDILRAIARAKEALLTPEGLRARAEAAGDARWRDVARVYAAYDTLLAEKGALDFADLVLKPLQLLDAHPSILAAERRRCPQILVDEYQDVNRAGAKLVQKLAGDGDGLWAVGDLRQAIYAFRGASPANVARFHQDFPRGRRTDLAVNYRSRPDLVAAFGVVTGEGPATWQAAREGAATLTLAVAADESAQADGIADAMHRFVADGYRWQEMAALTRTRGQARALRAALTARGVPVAPGPEEGGMLSRPEVRRLVALLARTRQADGPERRLLAELPAGLQAQPDAYALWTETLWGKPGWARRLESPEAVARLLELARAFREFAPLLLEPDEDPGWAFLEHLRRLARLGASFGEAEGDESDTVRILTVHASKGLEFPLVFVPNLSVGKFPARPAPSLLTPLPLDEEPDPGDEETRLFFVALTRARDHLLLSRAERYGRMTARPSPLLEAITGVPDLRERRWESREAPATDRSEEPVAPAEPATVRAGDAELYLRCPRRYAYEKIDGEGSGGLAPPYERFKQAVLATLEGGQTLEEAWRDAGLTDHPHAPLYRAAAEQIVARRLETRPADTGPEMVVELTGGAVTVRADALHRGALERHTFRRPPEEASEEASPEMRLSLLQEAARRQSPQSPPPVRLRYLQNDALHAVPDRPRTREKHLQAYGRAVRGIALQVFPAAPADSNDCPTCPFFFVCPA